MTEEMGLAIIGQINGYSKNGGDIVDNLTNALSIPRGVLPSKEEIDHALYDLPRELNKIPLRLRDEFIARATVATAVGLFDGAIVYIWDSVIKELRSKVAAFGTAMIKQVLDSKKNDDFLKDMTDAELLELCYQLNIIDEQGYFFLSQCREIRNQASVAHPSTMTLDDRELIVFISRCCKYGLSTPTDIKGMDLKILISVLESSETSQSNLSTLAVHISNTFQLQQEFIIQMLYSKYIDPSLPGQQRDNALQLAILLKKQFTNKIQMNLVSQHNELRIKGDSASKSAANSRKFFESVGLLSSLESSEQVAIFKKGIDNLQQAHWGINNFYTEPAFADRLNDISKQISPIPEIVINEYIQTLMDCYLGNAYGVSNMAVDDYYAMLTNLTPKGIQALLDYLSTMDESNSISGKKWKKDLLIRLISYFDESTSLNPSQVGKIKEIRKKFHL